MAGGERELRRWAARAARMRTVPVDAQATAAIGSILERGALQRMRRGVGPDGQAFAPLSRSWLRQKALRRYSAQFWQYSGESKRRLRVAAGRRGVHTTITAIINTPYSGAVHDGAVITRRHTSTRLSTRQAFLRGVAKRTRRREAALRKRYGETGRGSTARALERHAEDLRLARNARRRGAASLWPRVERSGRPKRTPGSSWTIRIPARPVLGISQADETQIGRVLAEAGIRRLEGGGPDA